MSPTGQKSGGTPLRQWAAVAQGDAGTVPRRGSSPTQLFISCACPRSAQGGRKGGWPTYNPQRRPGVKAGHVHHRRAVGGHLGSRQGHGNGSEHRHQGGHTRQRRRPREGDAGRFQGRTPAWSGAAQPWEHQHTPRGGMQPQERAAVEQRLVAHTSCCGASGGSLKDAQPPPHIPISLFALACASKAGHPARPKSALARRGAGVTQRWPGFGGGEEAPITGRRAQQQHSLWVVRSRRARAVAGRPAFPWGGRRGRALQPMPGPYPRPSINAHT